MTDIDIEARYKQTRAELEHFRGIEEGQSTAIMAMALTYGEMMDGSWLFRMASHAAKLFCIAAAFIIPNLLLLYVVL